MSYVQELKKFKKLKEKLKIGFKWQNDEERIRYGMSIPPKEKLERLYEIHEFLRSVSKKNQKVFLRKLKINH